MTISLPTKLTLGALTLAALAYPVANSFAVSGAGSAPAATETVTTASIECPMSAAKAEAMNAGAKAQTAEVPSISQSALAKAIADKSVVVIDVNGTDSYKAGHIPGALNFADIKDLKAALPADKDALVVAYCGNEFCGAYKKAATAAMELGYTNVQHFSPGIAGWKQSGAPVETA